MRWDAVTEAVANEAAGNDVLAAIYGEVIRAGGDAAYAVPSLEYHMITEGKAGDVWSPVVIQWDQRTESLEDLIASERELRELFDPYGVDVLVIGGVRMDTEYEGDVELVGPDRPGTFARALRFRHTPLRAEYVAPDES